jgi:hypothetical protein
VVSAFIFFDGELGLVECTNLWVVVVMGSPARVVKSVTPVTPVDEEVKTVEG